MNLFAVRTRLVDESTQRCRGRVCLAVSLASLGLVCITPSLYSEETNLAGTEQSELKKLSLEELMNLEVTSVSKKAEKLSQSAAAIYVLTQDDIRRSGATTIPDALRLVPGLDVARVDVHTWAISARGFNNVFANKLLVLIDGRSVYTPLFSGVFWDVQDVLLEDVDRIEVIRGPGAALWGANAVNGVINIITKRARDTQGGVVTAGGGTEMNGVVAARYGDKIGSNTWYRVYGKYIDFGHSDLANGNEAFDSLWTGRGGFRIDSEAFQDNLLTMQAEGYAGRDTRLDTDPTLTAPFTQQTKDYADTSGGFVLGRWTHTFSPETDLSLQSYYDHTDRVLKIFSEHRDTFDIDFQHRFPLGTRQEIIWGLGYRVSSVSIGNSFSVSFDPDHLTTQLASAFVQDEITIIKDRLRLTLGSKFEHNDFTGFEIQPSGRLLWTPAERQSVWAAVSRAVRSPSESEENIRVNQQVIPGAPPTLVSFFGDHRMDSETVLAYELGYRIEPKDWLSFDLAAFYNVYHNLRSIEPDPAAGFVETTPPPVHLVVPAFAANKMYGETYGFELSSQWSVVKWWRITANYTYLRMQLHLDKNSTDTLSESAEGDSPQQQVAILSAMDLPWHLELDCVARYVDSLPSLKVPAYATVDLRLAWKPIKNLEIAVVGQNLLDPRHPEFKQSSLPAQNTQVERSVYGMATWRF